MRLNRVVPELGLVTVRHTPDAVALIAILLAIFDPATQSPPEPGRCRFVATDNVDGTRSLLLWDRTAGDTWRYLPALTLDTDTGRVWRHRGRGQGRDGPGKRVDRFEPVPESTPQLNHPIL